MSLELELQIALDHPALPSEDSVRRWVQAALLAAECSQPVGLVVRIVDQAESETLNSEYRHKQYPTNVLSFPFELPPGIEWDGPRPLGDIVVCAPVVASEAITQHKPLEAHWAHMVVHGTLHLLGYDHQQESEAEVMEVMETGVLVGLGFADPYALVDAV